MFLLHVNWIVFYVTAHFIFFLSREITENMSLVTKAEHEGILYEFKKRWQMKQEKYSNRWKIFREITA